MTKVATIDRESLAKTIRPALEKKLAELSEELGINITAERATYGGDTGTFKLALATVSEDGVAMTHERKAFLELHHLYDLPKEALDAELDMGGHKVRVAGIKPKARKNNVLLDCTDGSGRQMVAPASTVKAAFKLQHEAA